MTDFSKNQIRTFIQELIHLEYLSQTQDKYPVLHLGAKSWDILKKKQTLMLSLPKVIKEKKVKKDYGENPELFEILRVLRKKFADEQNVPPYIIFSDVTIGEMASTQPLTKEEFADIKGVGKQKLSRYADSFLIIIRNYHNMQK